MPDPTEIDGTPQEVARHIARDLRNEIDGLHGRLNAIERMHRNAVMQDQLERDPDSEPRELSVAWLDSELSQAVEATRTVLATARHYSDVALAEAAQLVERQDAHVEAPEV